MERSALSSEERDTGVLALASWLGQLFLTCLYFSAVPAGLALALTFLTAAVLIATSSIVAMSTKIANHTRDLALRNLYVLDLSRSRNCGVDAALPDVEAIFEEARVAREKLDAAFAKLSPMTPTWGFAIMTAIWAALNLAAAWLGLRLQPEMAAALAWLEASAAR
jgi:hypothetical protein